MSSQSAEHRDELLADLDKSIEKALDAKMNDLAGALFRIQGSAKGWCEKEDCGPCPLAPQTCVNGIKERVAKLIDQHHEQKQITSPQRKITPLAPARNKTRRFIHRGSDAIPVDRYFSHLSEILAAQNSTTLKETLGNGTGGHRLRWQRVNDTFQQLASHTKRIQPIHHS